MKTESNFGLINQVKLNGIVGGGMLCIIKN